MLLAVLPVLYLATATAWNVTGADNGGLRWPVTATYVLVLTLAALLNVALWRFATTTRRGATGQQLLRDSGGLWRRAADFSDYPDFVRVFGG